ncbi:hypothetical protein LI291_10700 [Intestinibacillus massiliensis]|nr:hypothetical protein [Intestinibacillus massiliensis]
MARKKIEYDHDLFQRVAWINMAGWLTNRQAADLLELSERTYMRLKDEMSALIAASNAKYLGVNMEAFFQKHKENGRIFPNKTEVFFQLKGAIGRRLPKNQEESFQNDIESEECFQNDKESETSFQENERQKYLKINVCPYCYTPFDRLVDGKCPTCEKQIEQFFGDKGAQYE